MYETTIPPRSEKEGLLPILNWNIHDLMMSAEGPKTDSAEFTDILTKHAIFCLQETKGKVSLPDYICHNKLRKDSRSGGICIGVHRSIASSTKIIETANSDFLALEVFLNDVRFTIINVYDSPENSSYKKKLNLADGMSEESTLDALLQFSAESIQTDEAFLMGDMNARTGQANHLYQEIDEDQRHLSFPIPVNRTSRDHTTNLRGKKFLDLLSCTNLSLLNGAMIGDIFGEFTSINYNGASVVDYMAASEGVRKLVKSFKVLDLNRFSDHKPLSCKLAISFAQTSSETILDELDPVPPPYKFTGDDFLPFSRFVTYQLKRTRALQYE